jgi:hypothetical protein
LFCLSEFHSPQKLYKQREILLEDNSGYGRREVYKQSLKKRNCTKAKQTATNRMEEKKTDDER